MSNQKPNTQYGRCRKCGCACINHGKGWYHTEISIRDDTPGHYAEPMVRAA